MSSQSATGGTQTSYCDMQNKWFEHVTFVMNVGQSECPLSTIEIGVESLPVIKQKVLVLHHRWSSTSNIQY